MKALCSAYLDPFEKEKKIKRKEKKEIRFHTLISHMHIYRYPK